MSVPPAPAPGVPFRQAVRVWVRVALLSFGGPAGQIAVMHRILVEEKRWISETRFLHALNYCMLLPGPEAQQLATYVGWLLHGTVGGLVAGTLFILPGFLSILALSVLYASFGELAAVDALFFGLKAAVLAVVVEAVIRIGRRALQGRIMAWLAAAAFTAIYFYEVPFPVIVAAAALVGLVASRLRPASPVLGGHAGGGEAGAGETDAAADGAAAGARPSLRRTLVVLGTWLPLWWVPVGLLAATLGATHVLTREALFFSKAAVVTFGGAYSVLAYIAQQAVETLHWLDPGEMLDGLGMAETTPGPLIQVVQFVGFMGAWRNPAPFDPLTAAVLGSIVTTWVTFVPCFLWIFLGAPYIEALRGNRALNAALSAITAAVVGVILNLAVWFGLHVMFGEVGELRVLGARVLVPTLTTLDPAVLVLSTAAFVALLRFHAGMIPTLLACALGGMAWRLAAGG